MVITHNATIAQIADRVLRMPGGRIVENVRQERRAAPSELEW